MEALWIKIAFDVFLLEIFFSGLVVTCSLVFNTDIDKFTSLGKSQGRHVTCSSVSDADSDKFWQIKENCRPIGSSMDKNSI